MKVVGESEKRKKIGNFNFKKLNICMNVYVCRPLYHICVLGYCIILNKDIFSPLTP